MAAQQRAAHSREKGPDAEGKHLVAKDVDAHDAGRDFIVADAAQHIAEIAEDQTRQHNKGKQRPAVTGQQGGVARYALDAQGAVGHGRGVDDEHADDFSKAQGGDAQIVVAQAQHGHGNEKGENHGDKAAGQHGSPEGSEQFGERPDDGLQNPHHFLLLGRQDA